MKHTPALLILVGVWELVSGFLSLSGMVLLIVFILPEALGIGTAAGNPNPASLIAMITGGLILLTFGVISLVGAFGIFKGRNWGRAVSIAVCVLSMLWFPIGTVIGVLALIYLQKAEVVEFFG